MVGYGLYQKPSQGLDKSIQANPLLMAGILLQAADVIHARGGWGKRDVGSEKEKNKLSFLGDKEGFIL